MSWCHCPLKHGFVLQVCRLDEGPRLEEPVWAAQEGADGQERISLLHGERCAEHQHKHLESLDAAARAGQLCIAAPITASQVTEADSNRKAQLHCRYLHLCIIKVLKGEESVMYLQAIFKQRRHLVLLSILVVMTCTCVMHDEHVRGMTYVMTTGRRVPGGF